MARGWQRATSFDVALKAGVSRCFKPGASVAPSTRERKLAAANALSYASNATARGMITRRSNLVAAIISNLTNRQLTTVRPPVGRMSQAAVAMLLLRIEDPTLGPERWLFSGELPRGASAVLASA